MQRQRFGHESGTTGQSYGQQLAEIHANALPGITRTEEGEERPSPTGDLEQGLAIKGGSNRNYNDLERSRERERYEDYLDEQDSEKLPNAFDLGWKRNFQHLLGEKPTLWFLPICNTSGDGWHWEPSPKWVKAREEVKRDRETQWRQQEQWDGELDQTYDERNRSWDSRDHNRRPQRDDRERHYLTPLSGAATLPKSRRRSVGTEDRMNGHSLDTYTDGRTSGDSLGSKMSMKTIRRRSSFDDASEDEEDRYEVSSDEDGRGRPLHDGGWYGQSTEVASSDGQQRDEDGWRDWD
ncbi:palmitoyltransferase for Vac8p [Toensbergia leucococca]|nr:palmitoyltransferase for Vac8p [Toensbergia leucococca]